MHYICLFSCNNGNSAWLDYPVTDKRVNYIITGDLGLTSWLMERVPIKKETFVLLQFVHNNWALEKSGFQNSQYCTTCTRDKCDNVRLKWIKDKVDRITKEDNLQMDGFLP